MIKKIYTFGTSFTAGGGFEWNSTEPVRQKKLENNYGFLKIPKNQYSFSWPGRLQDLFNKNQINIQVFNEALQGYGNDRMIRKFMNLIVDTNIKKEDTLFIFEFSDTGRKEFYYRPIQDYIVCNYFYNTTTNDSEVKDITLANKYFYDSKETDSFLKRDYQVFNNYMNLTIERNEDIKSVQFDMMLFISFLEYKKINYIISSEPLIRPDMSNIIQFDDKKCIEYKLNKFKTKQIHEFIGKGGLSINTETKGDYDDFHLGLVGNNLVSKFVYNKMIDMGFLNKEKKLITNDKNYRNTII